MVSMAAEGMLSFSVASVVEDVLRQHDTQLSDIDLASRMAEEASLRRYEATEWLRKKVGVVISKDLPAQPSEEDFRLSLRSGIILCTAINKVQPGAVPKVVEAPNNSVIIPDGAALMAFQYFENLRNFLVAMEQMGLPTFEASDLEQGGKTARVVNCVLALKSFNDRKVVGGSSSGSSKLQGNTKLPNVIKSFARKNSEPFMNSIVKASSFSEKSLNTSDNELFVDFDFSDLNNSESLSMMVHSLIMNKKQEEIPIIVESMLIKVMEEFERRVAGQTELVKPFPETMSITGQNRTPTESPKSETRVKTSPETMSILGQNMSPTESSMAETHGDDNVSTEYISEIEKVNEGGKVDVSVVQDKNHQYIPCEASNSHNLMKQKMLSERQKMFDEQQLMLVERQKMLVERQKSDIEELKVAIHATKECLKLLQMKYQEEFTYLGKHLQCVASSASGYQKVLEENRKLYNQVQDLKGNIRVYCRVRPFLPGQANNCKAVDHFEDGSITINTPSKNGKDMKKSFTFNKVFGPTATQAEVFADMQPLVRSVLDGFNVCIFAYGQTGSGKTFTMTGPNNLTEETYGVNYRALNDLFQLAGQRKATISYDVSVQMMEIYNEQVRDLLATDGSNKRLEIRNSSQNGINVPDANRLPVSTTSDVINLMNLGHKNRAVCSTAMNDRSSRSHSCMTVHVQGKDLTSEASIRGSMHLVDLAGSERVDKSEVTGDRLKEATHINKSLSALGDVISSLASKNTHVPYRNSKLTQLLQDSLGGQAKTLMFVHISPEGDAIGETISTLKFAERVSTVELGAARANKESSDVKDLKEQIASLKAALARREDDMESLTLTNTPETMSVRSTSTTSSPMHPTFRSAKDTSSNGRRTPMEDVGNIKAKTKSTQKGRRGSMESIDLLSDTDSWPPLGTVKSEEKILSSTDWVDNCKSSENLQEENRKPCEMYDQPNGTIKQRFDSRDSDVQIIRYDTTTTDDIDELDAATSDSSEPDVQVQMPKASSLPNGLETKIKKPQVKASKSPERKSSIPMAPSRKLSNGVNQSMTKNGRQGIHIKRKTGNTK